MYPLHCGQTIAIARLPKTKKKPQKAIPMAMTSAINEFIKLCSTNTSGTNTIKINTKFNGALNLNHRLAASGLHVCVII
jgi:hypothetical protein